MTIHQTRQLGIEFERRLNLAYPASVMIDKPDTDMIYAMLNEFLQQYIKQMFIEADAANGRKATHMEDVLRTLTTHKMLVIERTDFDLVTTGGWDTAFGDHNCKQYRLPEDYFRYIRSSTVADKTYKHQDAQDKNIWLTNVIAKEEAAAKVIDSAFNDGAILRHPVVVLESKDYNYLKLIFDNYTNVVGVDLVYCRMPNKFNIINTGMDVSGVNISNVCELPEVCFDDLVDGAVQLYLRYKTGALQPKQEQKRQEAEQ